ncbi:MAG: mandelate racemase/muconate lactonizing enzyme family protein [Hyphomicrobiaceae bacterium]|nr:mandelate racemase/muconate lactonizing enzyme family protein [Hyphomicrobiaceae bacterium]
MPASLRLAALEAFVFRAPLASPVETSFGRMLDRPMVLVRATDTDGVSGWGEVWCNFPAVGAEHRARLVASILAPLATARAFADPTEAFEHLTRSTEVVAIQCAEPGPFAQCIAGVDTALVDLAARRAGQPVWRFLGGASGRIPVYASGLNPTAPEAMARQRRDEGHRAFKLKIGFGRERDVTNLAAVRSEVGGNARLMVDANQAWSLEQALEMLPALAVFGLDWLEEPIRADRPWSTWRRLAEATSIPLAGGENMLGAPAFAAAIDAGALRVVQPDLAKWGGFSGCLPVAKRILAGGRRFCPHYLGGGVGLLASAHLLAAAGGDGALEIDSNPNPLRSEIAGPLGTIQEGCATLSEAPGLGIDDPLVTLRRFLVAH